MGRAPDVADVMRITMEAYGQALSMAMAFLGAIPRAQPPASPAVEQWLRLARMTKDGLITAVEQGFEVWERECRRAMSGATTASTPPPPVNPFEVWADNWRKMVDTLTASARPTDPWAEQARQQAETMQRAMQEGLKAWQRLWQPPARP